VAALKFVDGRRSLVEPGLRRLAIASARLLPNVSHSHRPAPPQLRCTG